MAAEQDLALHDIGVLLDRSQTSRSAPLLKPNLVFHSATLSQASSEQNRHLRDDLRITTILDTIYTTTQRRYVRDKKPPGTHKSESHSVEYVLGVTYCHVYLRSHTFAQNLLNELPLWEYTSFAFRANFARPSDPKLVAEAAGFSRRRSVVDDSFAVLKAASESGLVSMIFNEILYTNTGAFPLLIVGDVRARDSLIILFLLLSMLDFDSEIIKQVIMQVEGSEKPADHWMEGMKKRLDAAYGSKEEYFRRSGVTKAAENAIREALIGAAVGEKSGSLLD